MRLMKEEERQDHLEVNMNMNIQHIVKKMAQVDSNVKRLVRKNKNHKVEIQHLGKEQEV